MMRRIRVGNSLSYFPTSSPRALSACRVGPCLSADVASRRFALRLMSSNNDSLKDAVSKINKAHQTKVAEGDESADESSSSEAQTDKSKESESAKSESNSSSETPPPSISESLNELKEKFGSLGSWVRTNFSQAWEEMTGKHQPSALERKVHQADSFKVRTSADAAAAEDGEEEEAEKYEGPTSIVVVKDPVSAWERMKDRLRESPLIKEILKNSKKIGEAAAGTDIGKQAQKLGQGVRDKWEDAREVWETSQNPIVYTLSGVWENLTGTTEEGHCIAQLRKLDPAFDKEAWAAEVRTNLTPMFVKAHLLGDAKALKPWCGEAVYNKLAAEIRARKQDGIVFDSNILDVSENVVIMRQLEDQSVCVVVVYGIQQINCVKNKAGEIIEGSETDIRMKHYQMAFQQAYDEETSTVSWKVVDYVFAGDVPYI